MIKNRLKTVILGALLVGTSLFAQTQSLVGIEGGASSVSSTINGDESSDVLSNFGLKIGAEGENYRIFLAVRHNNDLGDKVYDSLISYGGEIQYKFNVAKAANIFIGANAGKAKIKYNNNNEFSSSTSYVGADIGTNIHINNTTDFELGARHMSLKSDSVVGKLNSITTAYASIIFKWTMD